MPAQDASARAACHGLATELLRAGRTELVRARATRGASRRTAERIRRALATLALAASLLGAGQPAGPAMAQAPDCRASTVAPQGQAWFFRRPVPGNGTLGAIRSPEPPRAYRIDYADFADLDGDGDLDVIYRDLSHTYFAENTGTATAPLFKDGELVHDGGHVLGPPGLSAFDLADLDGDGDFDLIVGEHSYYGYGGLLLFVENTGTPTSPDFYQGGVQIPDYPDVFPFAATEDIYVQGGNARPEFADIDGDGDLDLFLGEGQHGVDSYATEIFFLENTGTATAPAFGPRQVNPFGITALTGSVTKPWTPGLGDLDGDGDLDLLIDYNYSFETQVDFFENTGTPTSAAFAPPVEAPRGLSDLEPQSLHYAPVTKEVEFEDIDGDGDMDVFMIDAQEYLGGFLSETETLVWFEHLDGSGRSLPTLFGPPQTNPFGLSAVGTDVGTGLKSVAPEFGDIDGDGDFDVLVGARDGRVYFFENTGTASSPSFAAPQQNPWGVGGGPGTAFYAATPTLGDVDGDGDLDLFVGELGGQSRFWRNTGTPTAPAFDAEGSNPPSGFVPNPFAIERTGYDQSGFTSAPEFADVDGDGDLDLLIGEFSQGVFLLENDGNAFTFAAPTGNPWGLKRLLEFASPHPNPASLIPEIVYASPALADVDGDGDLDVFVGLYSGETLFFENEGLDSILAPTPRLFAPVPGSLGLTDVGEQAAPDFVDIDGDGDLDAFIGNKAANIVFFENLSGEEIASADPGAGGMVTTDCESDGAAPEDPVEVGVVTPNAGTVTIETGPATGGPSGFEIVGVQADITAPVASASSPLELTFEVDASLVPVGEDETTIVLFRNGVVVPDCGGPAGEASPDPCVSMRLLQADGDVELHALTSAASTWSFGFGVVCGDGWVGGDETCDDGNTVDGDCCSSTCAFEAPGSACDDGNVCTSSDTCVQIDSSTVECQGGTCDGESSPGAGDGKVCGAVCGAPIRCSETPGGCTCGG